MDMGFDAKKSERALRRANNDFNKAVDMLSTDTVPEADEFDMMYDDQLTGTSGKPRAQSISGDTKPPKDHFEKSVEPGAPVQAMLDPKVAHMLEMGFKLEDIERALEFCKNDYDQAVQMLLSGDPSSA